MSSLKVTNKSSFYIDRMHNEQEMERLKVLCLLPKQTFVIIFSASPPGCGAPTGVITVLPPQLRKADGKYFLVFLVSATKSNLFITEGAAAGVTFPSRGRTERRNSAGVAVTLQDFTKTKQRRTDSDARL